jgi:hypothetical protein
VQSCGFFTEEGREFVPTSAASLERMAVGTQRNRVAAMIPTAFRVLDDVIHFQDGITIVGVADGLSLPASRVLAAPLASLQHGFANERVADTLVGRPSGTPLVASRTFPFLCLTVPLHVQLVIGENAERARLERQGY